MTQGWLILYTVLEIVGLAVVLVVYVALITRRLRSVATTLGRLSFGVRAVEQQLTRIGPSLRRTNAALEDIVGEMER